MLLKVYTGILCLTTCLHTWTCFWRFLVQPFLYPEVSGMMPIDLESGDNHVMFLSPGDLVSSHRDHSTCASVCPRSCMHMGDHVCLNISLHMTVCTPCTDVCIGLCIALMLMCVCAHTCESQRTIWNVTIHLF